ncbi:MAG TPA: hypothetical protein VK501_00445 [Baekduia sp.]|uniref:hypothetical protein n=1 Tax=Baekduia sp. TaxID=2600305 RepID=UPI002C44B8C6|nr:hypothetical protein [Baekduia sp.]HMJ32354.1 hypothetical protein [Baekduia sp.]
MSPLVRSRRAAGIALVGLASGCAASAATPPAPTAATPTVAAPAKAVATSIDRLTATARRRYADEAHGGVAVGTPHRVGRDPGLRRALASGNVGAVRAYVRQEFGPVWYHWHVSRVRIVQGSRLLADAGVPFVVAPTQMTLRTPGGRTLGRLQVSIQDEIGFVRYMHRNYPVDVVVRGRSAAHVRASLPAAAHAKLPSRGTVTITGRRYVVGSFHETALAGEPVTVWILTKG